MIINISVKIIKTTLILALIVLVGVYMFKYKRAYEETVINEQEAIISEYNDIQTVTLDENEYSYVWIQVNDLENLFLYPNFENKDTLEEGVKKYECKNLVSGGFYSKDYSPIGLFISEEKIVNKSVENTLLNGYFILTKNNKATIEKNYLGESIRIGLQTGPILIQNEQLQKLNLVSDKNARRIVAALTNENELYFIAFYDKESVFLGPLLVDLPRLVNKIQDEMDIKFISAINLDGGSASAYFNKDIQLSELTPIGSFFCEK